MILSSILQKIRASWHSDSFYRDQLVSMKDLTNIARSFNVKSDVRRNANHLVSVESWIEEMRGLESSPIIYYQEPSEDGSTHARLALLTKGQQFMLKKHSHNINAMNSTHGTNDYGF